jgi:hypothetical protein
MHVYFREASMSLTSQSLTEREKELYKRIEDKAPNQVKEIRRQIVESQIKKSSQLSKNIAKEIRQRILTRPEFQNL